MLSDIVLLTYYSSIKDYSDIVPHLARLSRNMYLGSCLDKLIFSINIADNWGRSSNFTDSVLKKANDCGCTESLYESEN